MDSTSVGVIVVFAVIVGAVVVKRMIASSNEEVRVAREAFLRRDRNLSDKALVAYFKAGGQDESMLLRSRSRIAEEYDIQDTAVVPELTFEELAALVSGEPDLDYLKMEIEEIWGREIASDELQTVGKLIDDLMGKEIERDHSEAAQSRADGESTEAGESSPVPADPKDEAAETPKPPAVPSPEAEAFSIVFVIVLSILALLSHLGVKTEALSMKLGDICASVGIVAGVIMLIFLGVAAKVMRKPIVRLTLTWVLCVLVFLMRIKLLSTLALAAR